MLYTDENPYEKNTISPSVQSRVTVVQGAKDNVATRRTPKILRELLPGADHILLPGVGHILHFEAPDEIVKLSLKV
jgi:pimeloyl-ACP methyl ester carboxylesterase